jgi:proteic killer suppression protein
MLLPRRISGSTAEACVSVDWIGVAKIVARKLDMLHYALKLDDLRSPPANRLEALKGDLKGFFSIRVNDQWRIVFRWTSSGPEDVDVTDDHA